VLRGPVCRGYSRPFIATPTDRSTILSTISQDLRFQIQDSPSGYFLGPFSFRLPVPEGRKKGELVNTGRENLEIRLGEKLSDFVELGEVFGSFEKGVERVLEVVRGTSLSCLNLVLSCERPEELTDFDFQSPSRRPRLARRSSACATT
jgi:hypothetical protein